MLKAEDGNNLEREQVQRLWMRLHSVTGLWARLRAAAQEGKPKCMRKIIAIALEAGIIEKHEEDPEAADFESRSFTIYSGHHEASGQIGLNPDESAIFAVIIWSLEGKRFSSRETDQIH
jgi:hypothetical protein